MPGRDGYAVQSRRLCLSGLRRGTGPPDRMWDCCWSDASFRLWTCDETGSSHPRRSTGERASSGLRVVAYPPHGDWCDSTGSQLLTDCFLCDSTQVRPMLGGGDIEAGGVFCGGHGVHRRLDPAPQGMGTSCIARSPDMTAPCQVPWGDFGSGPWAARVQAVAGAPLGLPGGWN